MGRYKLIIFDWEGTLSDSLETVLQCLEKARKELHLPAFDRKKARDLIGLDIFSLTKALFENLNLDESSRFIQHYQYCICHAAKTVNLFTGVKPLLKSLETQDVLLAIATSKSRKSLDIALKASCLENYFFSTKTPNECRSKPHPEMLEQLLNEAQVPKNEAVMVGDSPSDMQCAFNVGIDAIGVDLTNRNSTETLHKHGAKKVYNSVRALNDYLLNSVN